MAAGNSYREAIPVVNVGDGVEAARAEWVAPGQPPHAEPGPPQRAEPLDCFNRVLGAGRDVAAGPAEKRRQHNLVYPDGADKDARGRAGARQVSAPAGTPG